MESASGGEWGRRKAREVEVLESMGAAAGLAILEGMGVPRVSEAAEETEMGEGLEASEVTMAMVVDLPGVWEVSEVGVMVEAFEVAELLRMLEVVKVW